MEHESFQLLTELLTARRRKSRLLQPGFDILEPRSAQASRRTFGVGEKPRLAKLPQPIRKLIGLRQPPHLLPQPIKIRATAALGVQPTLWPQRPIQVAKQAIVIANPIKRCRAENTQYRTRRP